MLTYVSRPQLCTLAGESISSRTSPYMSARSPGSLVEFEPARQCRRRSQPHASPPCATVHETPVWRGHVLHFFLRRACADLDVARTRNGCSSHRGSAKAACDPGALARRGIDTTATLRLPFGRKNAQKKVPLFALTFSSVLFLRPRNGVRFLAPKMGPPSWAGCVIFGEKP